MYCWLDYCCHRLASQISFAFESNFGGLTFSYSLIRLEIFVKFGSEFVAVGSNLKDYHWWACRPLASAVTKMNDAKACWSLHSDHCPICARLSFRLESPVAFYCFSLGLSSQTSSQCEVLLIFQSAEIIDLSIKRDRARPHPKTESVCSVSQVQTIVASKQVWSCSLVYRGPLSSDDPFHAYSHTHIPIHLAKGYQPV